MWYHPCTDGVYVLVRKTPRPGRPLPPRPFGKASIYDSSSSSNYDHSLFLQLSSSYGEAAKCRQIMVGREVVRGSPSPRPKAPPSRGLSLSSTGGPGNAPSSRLMAVPGVSLPASSVWAGPPATLPMARQDCPVGNPHARLRERERADARGTKRPVSPPYSLAGCGVAPSPSGLEGSASAGPHGVTGKPSQLASGSFGLPPPMGGWGVGPAGLAGFAPLPGACGCGVVSPVLVASMIAENNKMLLAAMEKMLKATIEALGAGTSFGRRGVDVVEPVDGAPQPGASPPGPSADQLVPSDPTPPSRQRLAERSGPETPRPSKNTRTSGTPPQGGSFPGVAVCSERAGIPPSPLDFEEDAHPGYDPSSPPLGMEEEEAESSGLN